MKILVPVKRVVDYNVKVRVKSDGSGVDIANVKMSMNPFDEIGVLGIFRPKTTKCSGGPAVCGLQRGITFFEIPIWALFE